MTTQDYLTCLTMGTAAGVGVALLLSAVAWLVYKVIYSILNS